MALSNEMRRLVKKWGSGTGWPKRLEWMELNGLRGWAGQRIEFSFPIVAIVGENGSGKSTLLQGAACAYQSEIRSKIWYASDFFPDTAWDKVREVTARYGYLEGASHKSYSLRKPTSRWLGNTDRPLRPVEYVDLSRIQPVAARVGYAKIAKTVHTEESADAFDERQVKRLSEVMGRDYDGAKMALSNVDPNRRIPVIKKNGTEYSGFHQGSGETTVVELLQAELPKYGLVLIDEIESSLHPRAQRRLIRELAERCREQEVQIILTTHSPYILEELPLEARLYILETGDVPKQVVHGVSPQFAMSKMDDESYPECDLYVEDSAAKILLGELLACHGQEVFVRCQIVPFGAANVGRALGQMAAQGRFPRPSCVFLDGDNSPADGCRLLPGGDAPEQVVFGAMKSRKWGHLWTRIGRDLSLTHDACTNAMTLGDHHDWVRVAANNLMLSGDTLWQAMCAEWVKDLDPRDMQEQIVGPITSALPS